MEIPDENPENVQSKTDDELHKIFEAAGGPEPLSGSPEPHPNVPRVPGAENLPVDDKDYGEEE